MQICYLLAFPDPVETPAEKPERIKGLKDAPYFQPVDIDVLPLATQTLHVEGVTATIVRQRYDGRVQMIECRFELDDPLNLASIQHRVRIEQALQEMLVPEACRASGLFETYIILLVKETAFLPDTFIEENAQNLARFIRSQREVFEENEIEDILVSRVRYSRDELTLVDWEGAVVISGVGDFQSDIELLKIGNYQLLRYRMIDQSLDDSLREINRNFKDDPRSRRQREAPTRAFLRRIIALRLELMLEFEHTAQNLLLIGDWYTAKLYKTIQDELYLDNWRQSVKEKLTNLEEITTTIQENFSLSWEALMEKVDIIGWLILLVGYFVLFFMDAGWLTFNFPK